MSEPLSDIAANLDRVARRPPVTKSGRDSYRRRLRQYVLRLYGDGRRVPCVFCGAMLSNESMTLDRIIPGAKGGRYTRDNVQPACAPCNRDRGSEPVNLADCPYCDRAFPDGQPYKRHVAQHDKSGTRKSSRRRKKKWANRQAAATQGRPS
jgi:5-methylcytosine-specific restriction endonuclease McrA